MQFLNRFKIKTRIAVLAVIPLLVIFLLLLDQLRMTRSQLNDIEKLDEVLEYTKVTYDYIAEALEESFYSRLYIDSQEASAINNYQRLLNEAKNRTLEEQRNYFEFVDLHADSLSKYPVLSDHINFIRDFVKEYELAREGAVKRTHIYKTGGREVHTMYTMGVLIRRLVVSLSEVAVLASQDPELGRMANSYYYLVVASMESSFHNNMVYTAVNFGRNAFVFAELYKGSVAVMGAQDLFTSFATANGRNTLRGMLEHPAYKKYDRVGFQARSNIDNTVGDKLVLDADIDWDDVSEQTARLYKDALNAVVSELLETKNALLASANTKVYQTLTLLVVLLLVMSVVSFAIAQSITTPLKKMVSTFSTISENKDMSHSLKLEGRDELRDLGDAFNNLIQTIRSTISGVREEAYIVNEKSGDVAGLMSESLALADSQLQATDSISVAINEMTATISEVANMATSTSGAVQNAYEISIESADSAKTSQGMMEKLTQELGTTRDVVNALNEECNSIGNVLSVIQGIAEQTNLLALNAAIEAARAGEMGRGFAVVADEVRSLAGRTQESTEQIQHQIEKLQQGASAAINNMVSLQEEGTKTVEIVIKNSEAFNVMKGELDNITQMAIQIATAAEEQTSVSNEINERIVMIKDDSEKIADKTNITTETTESLQQTGSRLNQYISEFKLSS